MTELSKASWFVLGKGWKEPLHRGRAIGQTGLSRKCFWTGTFCSSLLFLILQDLLLSLVLVFEVCTLFLLLLIEIQDISRMTCGVRAVDEQKGSSSGHQISLWVLMSLKHLTKKLVLSSSDQRLCWLF